MKTLILEADTDIEDFFNALETLMVSKGVSPIKIKGDIEIIEFSMFDFENQLYANQYAKTDNGRVIEVVVDRDSTERYLFYLANETNEFRIAKLEPDPISYLIFVKLSHIIEKSPENLKLYKN